MKSPFSHVADHVWSERQEGPYVGADPSCEEMRPTLLVATEADRIRAPVMPIPRDVPVPPEGSLEEIQRRFLVAGAGAYLEYPCWPVCCDRPATVVGIEMPLEEIREPVLRRTLDVHFIANEFYENRGTSNPLDKHYREFQDAAREGADGVAVFQCRACGRVYFGSHHIP
jgi:hypothetical protein